jgi:hypothetical protein
VQATINPHPSPQIGQVVDNTNPALVAIHGKEELAQQIQRQMEQTQQIQDITKGQELHADKTEENKEVLEAAKSIHDGIEQVKDALEKADKIREDTEEGLARNAFEANLAREIQPDERATSPVEVGSQLVEKIEGARDQVVASLDENSDRSSDDVNQRAATGAQQIEATAAEMQRSNLAFEKRIENEPKETRDALMDARLEVQTNILTEKADAVVAELTPPVPVRDYSTRYYDPDR